jgi:hypothetical protein
VRLDPPPSRLAAAHATPGRSCSSTPTSSPTSQPPRQRVSWATSTLAAVQHAGRPARAWPTSGQFLGCLRGRRSENVAPRGSGGSQGDRGLLLGLKQRRNAHASSMQGVSGSAGLQASLGRAARWPGAENAGNAPQTRALRPAPRSLTHTHPHTHTPPHTHPHTHCPPPALLPAYLPVCLQTRLILPSWLGVGESLNAMIREVSERRLVLDLAA